MKEQIKKALFDANKACAEKYAIDADYDTLAAAPKPEGE